MLVNKAIQEREADTLCANLEPEFGHILGYLQDKINHHSKPDYKFIYKSFNKL